MSSVFLGPKCAESWNWNWIKSVTVYVLILGTFKKISNSSLKGINARSVFGKSWPTEELTLKMLKQLIVVESQRHALFLSSNRLCG